MDADGKNVQSLTRGPEHDLHPSFSPDGRRLAFCRQGTRTGRWELWTIDLETGEQAMVGFGLFPDWSPRADRDMIAFQRARQRGGRWFSLWTMQLTPAGDPTRVTEVAVSPAAALVAPAWSPDGERLAFSTVVDPDGASPGRQDVWTVAADGSDRRRLTDGTGQNATPAWSSGRPGLLRERPRRRRLRVEHTGGRLQLQHGRRGRPAGRGGREGDRTRSGLTRPSPTTPSPPPPAPPPRPPRRDSSFLVTLRPDGEPVVEPVESPAPQIVIVDTDPFEGQ